jgi:hypothetical protein
VSPAAARAADASPPSQTRPPQVSPRPAPAAPVSASPPAAASARPAATAPPLTQRRPGTSWPVAEGVPTRPPATQPEHPAPDPPPTPQPSLFGEGMEHTRASMGNMLGGEQGRGAPSRPIRRETADPSPRDSSTDSTQTDASIFDALESRWFEEHAPRARRKRVHEAPWSSPADGGWTAAERLFEETKAQLTGAGLPRREPMSHLVPGSVAPGTGRRRRVSDSDPILHGSRDAWTNYQAGIERARFGDGIGGSHP